MRPKSEELDNLLARYDATTFMDKFEREKQGEGWKVGEKVGGSFIITDAHKADGTIDKTKLVLLVDGVDVRQSDEFVIGVTPKEYEDAQQFKGLTFNGVVEVASKGEYKISNMFAYDAKPVVMESHLPTNPESIEGLEQGQAVIVEGEVVGFRITEYWQSSSEEENNPRPKNAVITVKTDSGRIIEVDIDPNVSFEQSSKLENISRKAPMIGDVIRINSSVVKTETPNKPMLSYEISISETESLVPGGITEPVASQKLYAPWCRSTYLLQPSQERQKEYDKLRESIGQEMANLEGGLAEASYEDVRHLASGIIKKEVTESERERLDSLIESMPENERPLMDWRRYEADEVNKLFDIDVDAMTQQEFLTFCRKAVSGVFADSGAKRGDHSYIYRIMEDIGMSPDQQEEIAGLAAETRIKYFEGLDKSGGAYDHQRDWNDKYMAEQSLQHLAYLKTPSAANRLMGLSHKILASGTEGEGLLKEELGYHAASGLKILYESDSPNVKALLTNNLEKIKEMERQLVGEQIVSPETKDSRMVALDVGTPATGTELAFRVSATRLAHHKYTSELGALREVISGLDPFMAEIKKGDFHDNITERMEKLADKNQFFGNALKAVKKKGYRFVLYDPNDGSIPISIHRLMYGANGAVTSKGDRAVYFDLDALGSFASRHGQSTEIQLNHALIDESVHMMSDLTYDCLTPAETETELKRLEKNPKSTANERKLHEVIKEEILADMVSRIVSKQLEAPDYRMAITDFDSDSDFAREFSNVKAQLGMNVLSRIYSVDLVALPPEEQKTFLGRLADFLGSGKIEKHLKTKLRELDLLV
jgi:hypothetical protein